MAGRRTACSRRRVGEGFPDLRYPVFPTGQSGVSQVTGPSSSAVPQSTTPPVPLRLAFSASGSAAFRVGDPLSIRNEGFEAAFLRPTRSPDYASTAPSRVQLQVWLPACRLRFGWVGLAPTGRLLRVSVYIPDLLSDRHCLVASTNARALLDDLNHQIFSIHEPKWSTPEDTARIKSMKKKIYEIYSRLARWSPRPDLPRFKPMNRADSFPG